MGPPMTPSPVELAQRSAAAAPEVADGLADGFAEIARELLTGNVDAALEHLAASLDPLQKFLNFLRIVTEEVRRSDGPLGAVVADYSTRLHLLLDKVLGYLDARDLVGLTLALEHGMAVALSDYRRFAKRVEEGFVPAAVVRAAAEAEAAAA